MKWFLSYKKWGKLVNHYQQVLCNPSSKLWYNPLFMNSSNLDVEGLLSQESGLDNSWNNTRVGLIVWQPLLQANFHSPPLGKRSNFSFMVVHNKCWWNVICFHQINKPISYGVALSRTILRELGSQKEIKTCASIKFRRHKANHNHGIL
jgi:hypothetical protein